MVAPPKVFDRISANSAATIELEDMDVNGDGRTSMNPFNVQREPGVRGRARSDSYSDPFSLAAERNDQVESSDGKGAEPVGFAALGALSGLQANELQLEKEKSD